jgi:hypothetical protein
VGNHELNAETEFANLVYNSYVELSLEMNPNTRSKSWLVQGNSKLTPMLTWKFVRSFGRKRFRRESPGSADIGDGLRTRRASTDCGAITDTAVLILVRPTKKELNGGRALVKSSVAWSRGFHRRRRIICSHYQIVVAVVRVAFGDIILASVRHSSDNARKTASLFSWFLRYTTKFNEGRLRLTVIGQVLTWSLRGSHDAW